MVLVTGYDYLSDLISNVVLVNSLSAGRVSTLLSVFRD